MSVVIETTLGDVTVDLFTKERPRASINFLKLCKMKYYNFSLFHTISRGFIAQTGDPTGSRNGGESIHGVIDGPSKRYFEAEKNPRIKHTHNGLVSFVGNDENLIGSQFFITLGNDLTYLDDKHCVFGEVMEGLDVLELLNETICDNDNRPYKDVRITHTVVLDDPFPDFKTMRAVSRSPSPSKERLQGGRIAADEDIDDTEGKSAKEISEMLEEREAKARATILEMVGDLPDAEMAPPENVLFVCKLNPVTTDDDLEIIFSRFGKINTCEVIRDRKTGDSLQYAFVEFAEQKSCEDAYFKMDNVLIDDRRIHVDFSQSVSKIKWNGKGRGVTMFDENGRKTNERYKGDKKPQKIKKRFNQANSPQPNDKYKSSRNRSRSPVNKQKSYSNRSRSPRNKSKSPNNNKSKSFRNRSKSRSPANGSRSPSYSSKAYRNRSRSPSNSKAFRNRSRSPNKGFRNRSPFTKTRGGRFNNNFKPLRNQSFGNNSSYRNRSRSPNIASRNRSRSPNNTSRNRSPNNNSTKSFRNRSRSPKASSNYGRSRNDKIEKYEKAKNNRDSSSSSEDEKAKKKNKKIKTKRASSSSDEKSKRKLSKKSKKHLSSEDEEDSSPKKKKKSKHKKHSKRSSSTSSSEEEVKKKSKKKKTKKYDSD